MLLRGLEGRAFLQLGHDTTQNTFKILSYIFILDSYNLQTTRCQNTITFCIVLDLLMMNTAIHFDHQSSSMTVEIHNKSINDLLPTKVKPLQSIGAKTFPENALFFRHLTTKHSCPLHLIRIHSLPNNNISLPHPTTVTSSAFLPLSSQERGPGG